MLSLLFGLMACHSGDKHPIGAHSAVLDSEVLDSTVLDSEVLDSVEDSDPHSDSPNPCEQEPDPERSMALEDIFLRLDAQRCLHEEDIQAVEDWEELFNSGSTLVCDTVFRLFSPDGDSFEGEPERVVEHASVPDVIALPDGSHMIVYNDVTPGKLAQILREDPERLFRQGLLGYGGVGMSIDRRDGAGFVEVTELDLHLPQIQEAVDPDLGFDVLGRVRLVWFGVEVERITPDKGPLFSPMPHDFYRGVSEDGLDFSEPLLAVASVEGETGGSDPTVLTLDDGGEILFLSPIGPSAVGWTTDDGEAWDPNAPSSVDSGVPAATADVVPVEGGYRMYYMMNGQMGQFRYNSSTDGVTWSTDAVTVFDRGTPEHNFNPSVTQDAEGWWLYYNAIDPDCETR